MEQERICQTCKHFYQHYIKLARGTYNMCGSGHCVHPRLKFRYNNTKACQHYVLKEN